MLRAALLALVALGLAPLAAAQSAETYVQQAGQAMGAPVSDVLGSDPASLVESLAYSIPVLAPSTNAVAVDQQGNDNRLFVQQTGLDNRAVLVQRGDGNSTELRQLGDRNQYLSGFIGDDNTVTANQLGNDNVYSLSMATSGTTHEVTQNGDSNLALQTVAPGLQPIDIQQDGSGMVVYVDRNY